ncbi:MAG: pyridoxal phosphate-dependent aminotransferase [Eggerthellaceae bacterium]|nr:pyridoxal phosphate-dependent aminotransferase [Eggerthellaceae bacterium]MBQ9067772.1 pyridoxal phosphate-dependent aminotransferase [Eggerthellaceae bacterium]
MYNEVMYAMGVEPSVIRELFAYGVARKAEIGADKVFDFSIGNPSVPAPASVGHALEEIAQLPPAQVHAYTQAAGDPAVRTIIAENLNARFGTDYTAANLYLTCGAAASLSISLKAVLEPNEEVVVVAPFFPEYRTWIETHGATLVMVPARESDFQIDLDAMAAAITPRTKAVIINSPNNPVGVVYSRETLEGLAALLNAKQDEFGTTIFLISDEPYRELVYGGVEVPWVPSIYANTIVCYSWSKSLSLPGERVGYILVPQTLRDWEHIYFAVAGAGRALGFVCAPAIFQQVIARCIDEPADLAAYEHNRELLTSMLDELGFEYIKPQGAFYLWMRSLDPDAKAFSEQAKKHELLIVASDSFGVEGWARLGYCIAPETITNSRDAFAALKADYE